MAMWVEGPKFNDPETRIKFSIFVFFYFFCLHSTFSPPAPMNLSTTQWVSEDYGKLSRP